MNKNQALGEIDQEWKNLELVLEKLGRRGLDLPAARTGNPPWNVRDVLYHITAWKLNLLDRAQKRLNPQRIRKFNFPGKTYHEQNLKIFKEGRTKSKQEVMDYLKTTHRELMKALEALPESEIVKDGALRSWIEGETISHPGQHRRVQLEPLLKK